MIDVVIGPVRRPVWGIPGRARKGPVVLATRLCAFVTENVSVSNLLERPCCA